MQLNKVYAAYFSPTHTSQTVALAVAGGTDLPCCDLDGTLAPLPALSLTAEDLLVVAAPVYGGHVAPLALKRLDALSGNGTPAVAVVVYGNRDFGRAAVELSAFLSARGFVVTAVAAFVGEHSYSTPETPIAAGRPSAVDRRDARQLGQELVAKLRWGNVKRVRASRLKCPSSGWLNNLRFVRFVLGYMREMKRHPVVVLPVTDASSCVGCGECARKCPTGAIQAGKELETDADKCIRCAACVKCCPHHARSYATPFAPVLSRCYARPKRNVWVL